MCSHNEEEDYDCLSCAFEFGREDAAEGLRYDPPYKDVAQCEAYRNGWEAETVLSPSDTDTAD